MGGAALIPSGIKEEVGEVTTKMFGSLASVAERSPAGQSMLQVIKNDFEPLFAKTRQTLTDAANHAISTGAQTPTSLQAGEITNKARNIATDVAFGKNHALLAHGLAWAKQTHGDTYSQVLADHVAMYLQDTVHDDFRGADVSRFKRDALLNKDNPSTGLDIGAVYSPRTQIESRLQGYASAVLAPFIAIPHLATPANLLFEPIGDLTKGIAQILKPGGYKAAQQFLSDTGVLNEQSLNAYRELQEYKNGMVAKATTPQVGYIVGKAIHAPGFNPLRDFTLTLAGTVGKLSAERFAKDAATGDRYAAARLQDIGLDPSQIVRQKGILTPDQLEKAIYHAVDNRVFLSGKSDRAYYSQKNGLTRLATMYHSYVTRQAKLLAHEGKLAWQYKGSNPANFAKTIATLGVAFPAIGAVTEMLEDYGRGQNGWDESKKGFAKLKGSEGAMQSAEQYIDYLAHIGGFGILTSYTRGIGRNELANNIIGPIGNVATRSLSDAVNLGTKTAEGKGDPSQVMRDVLEDTLPDNLGKILSHRFLPTKKEAKERSGSTSLHMKGLKGLKRLKSIQ